MHVRAGKLDVAQARHLEGAIDCNPQCRETIFAEFGIQCHGVVRAAGNVQARQIGLGQRLLKPARIREQGPAARIINTITGEIPVGNPLDVLGGEGERRAVRGRQRMRQEAEAAVASVLNPDVEEPFVLQGRVQGVGQGHCGTTDDANGLDLRHRGRRESRSGMTFDAFAIGHEKMKAAPFGRGQGFRGACGEDFPNKGIETGLPR